MTRHELQAGAPKDQYLLLRALDEALVSLTELPGSSSRIAGLQQQASLHVEVTLPAASMCPAAAHCRCVPQPTPVRQARSKLVPCMQVMQLLLACCEAEEECRIVLLN